MRWQRSCRMLQARQPFLYSRWPSSGKATARNVTLIDSAPEERTAAHADWLKFLIFFTRIFNDCKTGGPGPRELTLLRPGVATTPSRSFGGPCSSNLG